MTHWPTPSASLDLASSAHELYRGDVLAARSTRASRALCAHMKAVARGHLRGLEMQRAHALGSAGLYHALCAIRDEVESRGDAWALAAELARELGAGAGWRIDRPRLRAVGSGAWRDPAASRAYMIHRDSWYASPLAQINLWIPLFDLGPTEGFAFFPEFFDVAVENDSATFDYDVWSRDVGFQASDAGRAASFPEAKFTPSPRQARRVVLPAASVLAFSGAHLHATMGHDSGRTRWSVDVRIARARDVEEGRGAPNVDGACSGSTFSEFRAL